MPFPAFPEDNLDPEMQIFSIEFEQMHLKESEKWNHGGHENNLTYGWIYRYSWVERRSKVVFSAMQPFLR